LDAVQGKAASKFLKEQHTRMVRKLLFARARR